MIIHLINNSEPSFLNASFVKEDIVSEMSIDNFRKIISLIEESGLERISVSGGDITKYSSFNEIIEILMAASLISYVQFNVYGILSQEQLLLLVKLSKPKDVVSLCIYPEVYINNNKTDELIELCHTLQNEEIDLDFGLFINKLPLKVDEIMFLSTRAKIKSIKWEIALPINLDADTFYKKLKNQLISFLEKAVENKIRTYPVCCNIPLCFLTGADVRFLAFSANENLNHIICKPIINIYTDLNIRSCNACNNKDVLKISDFSSFKEIEKELETQQTQRNKIHLIDKCGDCSLFVFEKCGCLKLKRHENFV